MEMPEDLTDLRSAERKVVQFVQRKPRGLQGLLVRDILGRQVRCRVPDEDDSQSGRAFRQGRVLDTENPVQD